MIRYFCDCCGHEMQKEEFVEIQVFGNHTEFKKKEICETCYKGLKKSYSLLSRGFSIDN